MVNLTAMTDILNDSQDSPEQGGKGAISAGRASMVPPFSPVLLGGLLLAPIPNVVLRPLLRAVMASVTKQHPGMFERLDSHADTIFLIDPVDLPIRFLLKADAEQPKLTIAREADVSRATAAIHGSLLALIDLLEGRVDGDALFFSRELSVTGSTEAVVCLRNAMDDVDGSIAEGVADMFGPPGRAALAAIRKAGTRKSGEAA